MFDDVFEILMQRYLHQNIKDLECDILQLEDNIVEFLRLEYDEGTKKSIRKLESNLKYLGILANGASIEKDEDRRIMDFLRTHYDNLKKLSVLA